MLTVQLTLCVKSVDDMNTKKITIGKVSKTFLRNSSENEGWVGRTKVVESKSLKVGKSLKIGKNRIKSEKSDLIFY